jgi:Trk-type K+ transport system membrane component
MHGKLKLPQLTMLASKILTFLALVTLKMLAAILMRKTKTSSLKTILEEEQEPTKLLTPHNLQAILANHNKSPHPSISSTE